MTIDRRERSYSHEELLRMTLDADRASLWTALPCQVVSYNAVANTVQAQPTIKAVIQKPDGNQEAVNLPVLPDVPVVFPRGGGATLTFPIAPGDECLVVFSCRNIDSWWQSGGIQMPGDTRRHDLSDGFCIPGPMSQARRIGGISTKTTQLRSDDGSTYVELDQHGKRVNIVAPNGVTINTDAAVTVNAKDKVEVNTNTLRMVAPGGIEIIGNIVFEGDITTRGGSGENSTGSMTIGGGIRTDQDVVAGNISLQGHVHGGVQPGGGNTEKPK